MAKEIIKTAYERVKKLCDDYHHISGVKKLEQMNQSGYKHTILEHITHKGN